MSLRSPLHGGRQTSSERGRRNKGASARTCLHGSRRHHQQARLPPRTPDRLGVRDEGLAPVLPGLAAARAHHLPHLRARLVGRGSVGTQAFRCWRSASAYETASTARQTQPSTSLRAWPGIARRARQESAMHQIQEGDLSRRAVRIGAQTRSCLPRQRNMSIASWTANTGAVRPREHLGGHVLEDVTEV